MKPSLFELLTSARDRVVAARRYRLADYFAAMLRKVQSRADDAVVAASSESPILYMAVGTSEAPIVENPL